MVEPVPDPLIGVVLDRRYKIMDVVGQGGIGIVYRAHQTSAHGRPVAVKVLNRAASQRINTSQRFENEARIIGKLRHPNTIKLFDTGHTPDGRLYLVTEFLEGQPYSDVIVEGIVDQVRVVRVIREVSDALTEAHGLGIIHRDLKPANIFLESVGNQEIVKVLDFGVAKLVDNLGLTAPSQIFGTPGFMAPEQCVGANIDPRADLYSLGAVAYLALSGALPTGGETIAQLIHATVNEKSRPLSQQPLVRDIDPQVEGLVMQMIAKDPDDRPPSAEAVREICDNILKSLEQTAPVPMAGTGARIQRMTGMIPGGPTEKSYMPTRDPDEDAATIRPPFQIVPRDAPKTEPQARSPAHDIDGAATLPPPAPAERKTPGTPIALDGLRTEQLPPQPRKAQSTLTDPEMTSKTAVVSINDVAPTGLPAWGWLLLFVGFLGLAVSAFFWATK